jgi:dTDP-4-dehydrorhamnose reductase
LTIAILGSAGQLGVELLRAFHDCDVVGLTRSDFDMGEFEMTRRVLTNLKPKALVNSAAFHDVDGCERDPREALRVNALAVANLARVCSDLGCLLVQISTDYVFGGDIRSARSEEDLPAPENAYGISKLAGEHFIRSSCSDYIIVRTSGLYGSKGRSMKGRNFVETMIDLASKGKEIRVVMDQVLSPTYAKDVALKIRELMSAKATGLFHVTNTGECSWYEFASEIFQLMNLQPDFLPVRTEPTNQVRRPAYSVLANNALLKLGLEPMRSWQEALEDFLSDRQQALGGSSK